MKTRWQFTLLAILFLVLVMFVAMSGTPIVVLYKSSEGDTASQNPFARYVGTFARLQGYRVRYHDIDAALPPDTVMKNARAIVTVFHDPVMANAEAYIQWLSQQILHQRKVVILGNFGAYSPDGELWYDRAMLNPLFNLLGFDFQENWTDDPALLDIAQQDRGMLGADTPLTPERLTHYFTLRPLYSEVQAFLTLQRRDIPDSESVLVAKTPVGGIAMHYTFTTDPDTPQQLLNLKKFIAACLRDPIPAGTVPDKRILALYKHSEDAEPAISFIARFLSTDLIRLGYWPEYYAIDQEGVPDALDMSSYQAVISWFRTPYMNDAEQYVAWLLRQIQERRKVVILGNFGAFGILHDHPGLNTTWFLSHSELNRFFYPFGVEFMANWVDDPALLELQVKVPEMVEAERSLGPEDLRNYFYWRSVYPENAVYLQVTRRDHPSAESAFVVRTPFGGFAFEGYIYAIDPDTSEVQFFLNRFQFLQECLEYPTDTGILRLVNRELR